MDNTTKLYQDLLDAERANERKLCQVTMDATRRGSNKPTMEIAFRELRKSTERVRELMDIVKTLKDSAER
jgi:hypothetical protein